jgi:predicted GNAT family N-acyltransferase
MDLLAARMVARAAPLRFAVVHSREDLKQVYRLRRAVVIDKGWAHAEEIGDYGVCDRYDADAVHIAGYDGQRIVAAARLVLRHAGQLLPTEETFALRAQSHEVADVGRVVVAGAYRGAAHRTLWALLCRSWVEMRRCNCTVALTIITAAVGRMYRAWLI